MQQPFEQYFAASAQLLSALHAGKPLGHIATPPQTGGSMPAFWPGHSTHVAPPHAAPHVALRTQVRHAAVRIVAYEQPALTAGLSITSTQPAPSHIVQQPKQSQPAGARGAHFVLHCADGAAQSVAGLKLLPKPAAAH
jgi:hypothetical protein